METSFCQTHQREACVVDLTFSQFVCEKCALFNPQFKHHEFIDKQELPGHVYKLYQEFKTRIQSLQITIDKDTITQWKALEQLACQALSSKAKHINMMYDQMIAQLQLQRKLKISNLGEQIAKIVQDISQEVNVIVKQKYQQLQDTNDFFKECLKNQLFLDINKQFQDKAPQETITSIEKDLQMIELDLKQRLGLLNTSPVPDLDIFKNNSSAKEELLIFKEDRDLVQTSHSDWKTDRFPMKAIFKTQCNVPQTERISFVNSRQLDLTLSSIEGSSNIKKFSSKTELKNPIIKHNIKHIILVNLNIGNRQALEIIKKCTTNTFVSKIDLSNNPLNCQFVTLLKRQKSHSKYLKKIIAKGINLTNSNALKKQGINIEILKAGKFKVGDVSLIV